MLTQADQRLYGDRRRGEELSNLGTGAVDHNEVCDVEYFRFVCGVHIACCNRDLFRFKLGRNAAGVAETLARKLFVDADHLHEEGVRRYRVSVGARTQAVKYIHVLWSEYFHGVQVVGKMQEHGVPLALVDWCYFWLTRHVLYILWYVRGVRRCSRVDTATSSSSSAQLHESTAELGRVVSDKLAQGYVRSLFVDTTDGKRTFIGHLMVFMSVEHADRCSQCRLRCADIPGISHAYHSVAC